MFKKGSSLGSCSGSRSSNKDNNNNNRILRTQIRDNNNATPSSTTPIANNNNVVPSSIQDLGKVYDRAKDLLEKTRQRNQLGFEENNPDIEKRQVCASERNSKANKCDENERLYDSRQHNV